MVNERTLNVRLPGSEFRLLERYAVSTGRTKTEIVREFVRSLGREPALKAKPAMTKRRHSGK
jgi:predicted DNA-binding protein